MSECVNSLQPQDVDAPQSLQAQQLQQLAHKAAMALQTLPPDAASAEQAVLSPCINVCRMTEDRSHCKGCFRTIDEIRAWSRGDNAQRLQIWGQLLQRAGLDDPREQAMRGI